MLLVDAANVVGSRPNGWWRDRPGAARAFVERIRVATAAGRLPDPVIVVLEGQARAGVAEGTVEGVEVVHAPGSGDDSVVRLVAEGSDPMLVVTSDRGLRRRVESLGAAVTGPSWLLDRLDNFDP
jgi:hypothetical protein